MGPSSPLGSLRFLISDSEHNACHLVSTRKSFESMNGCSGSIQHPGGAAKLRALIWVVRQPLGMRPKVRRERLWQKVASSDLLTSQAQHAFPQVLLPIRGVGRLVMAALVLGAVLSPYCASWTASPALISL